MDLALFAIILAAIAGVSNQLGPPPKLGEMALEEGSEAVDEAEVEAVDEAEVEAVDEAEVEAVEELSEAEIEKLLPEDGEIEAEEDDVGTSSNTQEICSETHLTSIMGKLPRARITFGNRGNDSRYYGNGRFSMTTTDGGFLEMDLTADTPFNLIRIEIVGNVESFDVSIQSDGSDWYDPHDFEPTLNPTQGFAEREFGAAGIRVERVRVYPHGSNDTQTYRGRITVMVCKDKEANLVLMNDIAYNKQQYKTLFGDEEENSDNRTTYGGTYRSGTVFWPNGQIPYVIDPKSFTKIEMAEIREAMDVYEESTCVRFVQKTNQQNFIFIRHTEDGCYSLIGMNGGGQIVSLKNPGCRTFGTYLHELGHAIGLLHEHQMPTRAYHLKYYDVNVSPAMSSQLTTYKPAMVQTYGSNYDLGSIMHYNVMSFAIDSRSYTMMPNDPWAIQYIGRRYSNQLSFGDVRTVNNIYKCAVKWQCKTPCTGMTYHDKNCKCVTVADHHNKYCRNEPGLDSFCDELVLKSECDPRMLALHKNCAKSCDFCPRFSPGQSALTIPAKCRNIYPYQEKCAAWAKAGFCMKAPFKRFLHRYCRLSCQACTSNIGKCPNFLPNNICDEKLATNKCGMESVAAKCRDSCSTCLWRKTDASCKNSGNSFRCAVLANKNQCEEKPFQMFSQCQSTCNRCYFNRGSCKNRLSDKHCFNMARKNLCVGGPPPVGGMDLHQMVLKDCPRTCGQC